LPSSLTRVLPRAFVFSTRPPVSVSGTGTKLASLEAFLGSVTYGTSVLYFPPHHSSRFTGCAFHYIPRSLLGRPLPSGRFPQPPASPLRSIASWWYRNFNLLSFDYAFRPRLRSRLTLGGRAFPRNPWAFGGQDSHLSFRYSYRHSHFHSLHTAFQLCFSANGTLPYHVSIHSFGVRFSPVTFSAQRHSTSELLRTLSMVAASKPTSWLSVQRHIVPH
jgi:hypothetical protein